MAYQSFEEYSIEVTDSLKDNYKKIITELGENPDREGVLKTPERAAKAMQFLTQGYELDAEKILKKAMFKEDYDEMVVVKNIELYSLCEHHMLPFFGKAHIAYIPNGHIVGLSKLPRVVDVFARRLQVQERLTHDILECLNKTLQPQGVAVVIEAQHMCMMMRGVQKQNSTTTTSGFRGQFEKIETRNEFLKLISSDLS
ncbi:MULTISPECIES: GTP cyclohydrolase I FolE [Zunongwangia]|jgi:GTP cyclohydrolase I|uniref:GTP cyclohydrolase 1 n=2 Tax=Zunongwangia profunda TaxID=398743 RepID=D5BEB1_ZUNPS|nr:GTP cyclohydrolase I FolE [Zunongwangia profunda]MAC64724.1 GTP cyclohydrolase I FolE [Flavobacteriaceae bacterium]MAS72728.1 GTP cyclohydrolase I FolE [Zunongwangia sp.]ADF52870.1 GTP cyclohydrolase I [Zunongwangia profunda SM-A87]MCC4228477.1 GTP cyclohydrolase I FolE [Zunongwangia profunda]HAJ81347.1 GTP cyclohydrolase I FolE [Zunongwangia profunda]|tara:strand:- start:73 stop:669 length:597 start_codon:yes stop_codon:yes gene_type:complete